MRGWMWAYLGAAAMGLLAHAACTPVCTLEGCPGGFQWDGARKDAGPLALGSYRFAITIERDRYIIECQIAEFAGESRCNDPIHDAGDTDFFFLFGPVGAHPDGTEFADPLTSFILHAAHATDSDDIRGPTEVDIEVHHNGAPLSHIHYALRYDRDHDFWGDAACGYCDLAQGRSLRW